MVIGIRDHSSLGGKLELKFSTSSGLRRNIYPSWINITTSERKIMANTVELCVHQVLVCGVHQVLVCGVHQVLVCGVHQVLVCGVHQVLVGSVLCI